MQAAGIGGTAAVRISGGGSARSAARCVGSGAHRYGGVPEVDDHAAESGMGGEIFDLEIFGRRWIERFTGARCGRVSDSGKRMAVGG